MVKCTSMTEKGKRCKNVGHGSPAICALHRRMGSPSRYQSRSQSRVSTPRVPQYAAPRVPQYAAPSRVASGVPQYAAPSRVASGVPQYTAPRVPQYTAPGQVKHEDKECAYKQYMKMDCKSYDAFSQYFTPAYNTRCKDAAADSFRNYTQKCQVQLTAKADEERKVRNIIETYGLSSGMSEDAASVQLQKGGIQRNSRIYNMVMLRLFH